MHPARGRYFAFESVNGQVAVYGSILCAVAYVLIFVATFKTEVSGYVQCTRPSFEDCCILRFQWLTGSGVWRHLHCTDSYGIIQRIKP